jgi:predicted ATPase
MPIRQITIRNYKSLENLTLKMRPFMVFVGPNNAGKSNILDALHFLSDLIRRGQDALKERGGFDQIVFNGDIHRTISLELHGSIEVKAQERRYKYSIALEGDRWGFYRNSKEIFALVDDGERILLEFPTEQRMALVFNEAGQQIGGIGAGQERVYLSHFSDPEPYPVLGHFAQEVQDWAFFNLLPPLMREPIPVRRETQLQPWGQNLAGVLHVLQTEHPQKFKEIERILQAAIPEIEEVTTPLTGHEPGRTYIRIKEKGLTVPIAAWGMSDGTLRLLAHLATLYSPSPPPLMCFEEPEDYLHPRLLELIVDLLRNASDSAQILVTTHSPYLVNLLEPEDLFIVEKHGGRTQIKKAEGKKGVKQALEVLGLGDMWYSGAFGGVP